MSEASASDLTGRIGGDAPIFVSDASAEAERLTEALRQRGYLVVDVPLGLCWGGWLRNGRLSSFATRMLRVRSTPSLGSGKCGVVRVSK